SRALRSEVQKSARMGLWHPWRASISGLVPGRQSHARYSKHACQPSAGHIRAQPFRFMALVREEPLIFKRKAVAGAHPRGLAERKQKNGGGWHRITAMAVKCTVLG